MLLLVGLSLTPRAFAQAGALDSSYEVGTNFSQIAATALQSDDKLVAVGWRVSGVSPIINRFLPNGSADNSFAGGAFDLPPYGGASISALAVGSNGIVVSGNFSTYAGLPTTNVAKLLPNGQADTNFVASNTGIQPFVVALQTDGKVLVGGNYGLIRLHTNGSVDTNFQAALYQYAQVFGVLPLANGKILVAGSQIGDGVVRLNANGTLDGTFNPPTFSWGSTLALRLQADGKILVGGNFTEVAGSPRSGIVRLNSNGTFDATFDPGAGANDRVWSITTQADGKILLGGYFTTFAGSPLKYLVRLQSNGSIDTTFNSGTGPNGAVLFVGAQTNGGVVVSGLFSKVNEVARTNAARLMSDSTNPGTVRPLFTAYRVHEFSSNVLLSLVRTDGSAGAVGASIRVSGGNAPSNDYVLVQTNVVFPAGDVAPKSIELRPQDNTLTDGSRSVSFAVTNPTGGALAATSGVVVTILDNEGPGGLDNTFSPSPANNPQWVNSLVAFSDGNIVFGGWPNFNNPPAYLAQADLTGSNYTALSPINDEVRTIVKEASGSYLVGGYFYGLIMRRFASGAVDTNFTAPTFGPGFGSYVEQIAVDQNGKIYIAGRFNSVDGTPRPGLARLNADGSLDPAFAPVDPGFNSDALWITAMGLDSSNRLCVARQGIYYFPIPSLLARFNNDGSRDTNFTPNFRVQSPAGFAFDSAGNGYLASGGAFITNANNTARTLVRFAPNGIADAAYPSPSGATTALRLLSDDSLLVATLKQSGSASEATVLHLHATGQLDTNFVSAQFTGLMCGAYHANGFYCEFGIRTLDLAPDGRVLVGGTFTSVDGVPRPGLARLNGFASASPRLQLLDVIDGLVRLRISASPGKLYRLEAADALPFISFTTNWQGAATNSSFNVSSPAAGARQFYRLVEGR